VTARRAARLLTALSVLGSLAVFALYLSSAIGLVRYPWDWDPGEGLSLDYARRLLDAPGTLYARTVTPFPSAYGPLLPAVLAPVARMETPLEPARVVALLWTAVLVLSVFLLVRPVAPAALAIASAALALAPLELSFWYVLVRVDGLMVALWLLAAVPLVTAWTRGAGLGAGRVATTTGLLLLACLAKPTAAVHGLPLVLACWWVDRRGALRLWACLFATAVAAVGLLQWATSGGFLWVSRLWTSHPALPGLTRQILVYFGERAWPVLALCGIAALAARHRWRSLLADPAVPLLLGCVLVVPAMSKHGASWNYALPALPALAVATGRFLGVGLASGASGNAPPGRRGNAVVPAAAAVVVSGVALLVAAHQTFPLPTPVDERAARTLYGYVRDYVAEWGGPIIATRPDLAYVLVGERVEIEGSSFMHLAAAGVPGTEVVLDRLRRAEYTLVLETWPYPESGGYRDAIERSYVYAGGCNLKYYFGAVAVHAFSRRDIRRNLVPPPGTTFCGGPEAAATASPRATSRPSAAAGSSPGPTARSGSPR
jgi:4-amino-4-deoxy-L-arabinose transferase-like glycosyltransferase